jgi:gamma-glutamyltranspeptidase/glutathione hydrolase
MMMPSNRVRPRRFLALVALATAVLFTPAASLAGADWVSRGTSGMVATDSPDASQAGLEMLQAGGNAFDAAVAASFCLGVTRPQSTGLGGGGFLIARTAGGRVFVLDYRETAPASARPDMYARITAANPNAPAPSRYGFSAVATPGLLAGQAEILKRFGTKSLSEVIAPALRLAKKGFPVDQHYVQATRSALAVYREFPALAESCEYVYRLHLRQGDLRTPGETLQQAELARLLELISNKGPEALYRGEVAEALAKQMQAHGGFVTASDLGAYRPANRTEPIRFTYREYEILTMPPPSSGGICIAEALNILETVDLPAMYRQDEGLANHYLIEALKHAFADRARWLGDADFVNVPDRLLTSKPYARQLAAGITPDQVQPISTYGAITIPDDAGTSHLCVVDRWGNCVSATETINTEFGSLAAVGEWGLILNNEMDDFSVIPNKANAYGLKQSSQNAVAPGKRPLSSMTPTIVLENGRPILLLGGSGGPRIITSVLQVMTNILDRKMNLEQAMLQRRLHHQWQPEVLFWDEDPGPALVEPLARRGHKTADQPRTGIVQAIQIDGNTFIGASDPRKGGTPAGY